MWPCKGPCDGVGGNAKISGDDAMRRSHKITSAKEFFAQAQTVESVINYIFVGNDDINYARGEVSLWEERAYRGLMSVHSVMKKAK